MVPAVRRNSASWPASDGWMNSLHWFHLSVVTSRLLTIFSRLGNRISSGISANCRSKVLVIRGTYPSSELPSSLAMERKVFQSPREKSFQLVRLSNFRILVWIVLPAISERNATRFRKHRSRKMTRRADSGRRFALRNSKTATAKGRNDTSESSFHWAANIGSLIASAITASLYYLVHPEITD